MCTPPETSMRCALTHFASSEQRNATTEPISSGKPTLPSAVLEAIILLRSLLSRTAPPPKSVSIAPVATEFTLICRAPNSNAWYFVSESIAEL